jgi:ribosomal protein S18 acetylase RimI-like enzyme
MLIRKLVATDAPAFRTLRLEGLRTHPEAFGSDYEESLALPEARFAQWIEEAPPGAIFGAFDGEALVGLAGLAVERGKKKRHKATLWGVFVAASHARRGLGRKLTQAVIDDARGQHLLLQASVMMQNHAARALYASLGFESYGIQRKAAQVGGVFIDDELLMLDFTEPG